VGNIVGAREGKIDGGDEFGIGIIVGTSEGTIGGEDFIFDGITDTYELGDPENSAVGDNVGNRDEGLNDGISDSKVFGTKMVSLPSIVLPITLSSTGGSACLQYGSLGLSLQNRLNCAAFSGMP
jgi:hypothetical protein